MPRKPFTMLLPASMTMAWMLAAMSGCKPDICKDPNLTAEQRCKDCKPRDDEMLARLNPTQLPWPVRKVVERCADQIHASDPRNFVTKQALRECANADPGLDSDTKIALGKFIDQSNLMEQVDLDNYHALCLASTGPATSITVTPARPAASHGAGSDNPTVPPAAARPSAAPPPAAAPHAPAAAPSAEPGASPAAPAAGRPAQPPANPPPSAGDSIM